MPDSRLSVDFAARLAQPKSKYSTKKTRQIAEKRLKNEMATSGKKASMGAAVGLIAAGAGIAAYYFLYLSKAEEVN